MCALVAVYVLLSLKQSWKVDQVISVIFVLLSSFQYKPGFA